jgi:hypothetical protein
MAKRAAVRWGKGGAKARGNGTKMAHMRRGKSTGVSAAVRKKYGGGKGLKPGSFPVNNVAHAESAIRLRGHAPNPSAVLSKVSRSRYAKNPTVRRMLTSARKGVGK